MVKHLSNKEKMTTHRAAQLASLTPIPVECERSPALASWSELEEGDQDVLSRVEAQAMDQFDQWAEAERDNQAVAPPQMPWFQPWHMAAVSAMALVAVLVWQPWQTQTPTKQTPTAWPTLQTHGHAQLHWQQNKRGRKSLTVDVPANQHAHFAVPKHWTLETQGGSKMRLQRHNQQHMHIDLHRGAIVAHVTPGKMKQFVVRTHKRLDKAFDVVVKGTIFAVRRGKGWLRVEVMRGRVEVRHQTQAVAVLRAGEGVRLTTPNARPRRYAIAQHSNAKNTLMRQLRWMSQHTPTELKAYAKDLVTQTSWSQHKRRAALELIANLLTKRNDHHSATSLWQQLFRWQPNGFEGQTALFQAAQACRKAKPKSLTCARLYHQWRRQFPKGMKHMRQASLYGLIRIYHQRGLHRKRNAIIRTYLTRFPRGLHRQSISQLQR